MFCFDIETLSKSSESVILSYAVVYFDPASKPSYQELLDNTLFVKLDAQDQMKRLHRRADKSTMDWWAKQCDIVRKKSFTPSQWDMTFEEGYEVLRKYADRHDPSGESWVWARGNLDQLVMDSMEEQLGVEQVFPYQRWRDVRTAIDFMNETKNGYVDVDYPGFDPKALVYKHDPVHDVCYDVMMMLYGKRKN